MSWAIINHIDRGLAAARPAANAVPGKHWGWFATDTGVLSISDGTTWITIGPGGGAPSAHKTTHEDGGTDEISLAGLSGSPADLTAHLGDTTDAHDASAISVADSGGFYSSSDVEGALAEVGAAVAGGGTVVKLYDFTITGTDQAAIDTNVDGTTVANFAGYDVLEWWFVGRTDDAGANAGVNVTVNNDTGANYDQQLSGGNNATSASASLLAQTAWVPNMAGGGSGASYAGILRMTIPNYLGTTFYKVGELTIGKADSTAGNNFARVWIAAWRNTAAITRLKVAAQGAAKLKVGSRLVVYGR